MAYQLVTVPVATKALKKLPLPIRRHLVAAAQALIKNPDTGELLKGEWRRFRCLHTKYQNTQYRLVYEVKANTKQVIIRFAASRENFYQKLRRLNLKPLA